MIFLVFFCFVLAFRAYSVEVGDRIKFIWKGFVNSTEAPIERRISAEIIEYDSVLKFYLLREEKINEKGVSEISERWVRSNKFPDKYEIAHMVNQCQEFNGVIEVLKVFSEVKNMVKLVEVCKTPLIHFDVYPPFEKGKAFYHGPFPIYGLAMAEDFNYPEFVLYSENIIFNEI